ncbi:MAG TPA: hypothetical protein VNT81_16440 [Vicinamibacterales bacterium]|nr:hypothetical protein [Vicinamibacterales bacterium]
MNFRTPSSILLALTLSAAFSANAAAQELKSAAPAKELAELLTARKLESIAARMPDSKEEFVGALAFPGQLMVVWAKTTAPAVLNEKLINKAYRDVYLDLNSASIIETRHFVTDLGPDGLKAKPDQRQGPADTHDLAAKSIRFDGNWREDKMSEKDYMARHAEADAAYAKAVQALIDELKKTS